MISKKWRWVCCYKDTIYLLKNLISNNKVAIFNRIFNSFFMGVGVKYKVSRRFTSVSYAVVLDRHFVLGLSLERKICYKI